MQLHPIDERRLELVDEIQNGGKFGFVVQTNGPVFLGQLIPQQPLNQVQIAMNHGRRAFLAQRFFRNLDKNLLTFPQQLGNRSPWPRRMSICPMFLLLDRRRTTPASASTAAGRTMRERILVGTVGDASARGRLLLVLW